MTALTALKEQNKYNPVMSSSVQGGPIYTTQSVVPMYTQIPIYTQPPIAVPSYSYNPISSTAFDYGQYKPRTSGMY